MTRRPVLIVGGIVVLLAVLAIVFIFLYSRPQGTGSGRRLLVIGAENEYANVLAQIGGRYVQAVGIMANPNTDPHTFEASTVDASLVAKAALVVQNGLGYDGFMQNLEGASPNPRRIVVTAAQVVGAPPASPNPHLWYRPNTMPKVAARIAQALGSLDPAHRSYYQRNLAAFDRSLRPWQAALRRLGTAARGKSALVTEPVADYLLQAAGVGIATPWTFQAAVMNGQDPSPQDVATMDRLLRQHKVSVLVYNYQAVDATTASLLSLARQHGVPVVGVYETMPQGYDYQRWMLAETDGLYTAIMQGRSEVLAP